MSGQGPRKKPAKQALGRGLAALLGEDLAPPTPAGEPMPRPNDRIIDLPLERLEPNPYQPRRLYDQDALRALADSIAEHGVLQPLVVRPAPGGYQLIAGERRMRACQMLGKDTVPVVVRQATDQQALLLALLENLQREDLNPMEEAKAFERLVEEFSLSHDEIASGVGKDRSTVANSLRLLKLPAELQQDISDGRISAGHARALLALQNAARMRAVRDQIVAGGLSVRATERLVKKLLEPGQGAPAEPTPVQLHIDSLADDLARRFGARVQIKRRGKKGSIVIPFASDDELERLLGLLR